MMGLRRLWLFIVVCFVVEGLGWFLVECLDRILFVCLLYWLRSWLDFCLLSLVILKCVGFCCLWRKGDVDLCWFVFVRNFGLLKWHSFPRWILRLVDFCDSESITHRVLLLIVIMMNSVFVLEQLWLGRNTTSLMSYSGRISLWRI